MEELEGNSKIVIIEGERSKNSVLFAGWLFAVASPLVLNLGSWLFVFPSYNATVANLVWFLAFLFTGIGSICGIHTLFKRRWLPGSLLTVASFVLLAFGVFIYSASVFLYFGADPS